MIEAEAIIFIGSTMANKSSNITEKRREQNRLAQRKHRSKVKKSKQAVDSTVSCQPSMQENGPASRSSRYTKQSEICFNTTHEEQGQQQLQSLEDMPEKHLCEPELNLEASLMSSPTLSSVAVPDPAYLASFSSPPPRTTHIDGTFPQHQDLGLPNLTPPPMETSAYQVQQPHSQMQPYQKSQLVPITPQAYDIFGNSDILYLMEKKKDSLNFWRRRSDVELSQIRRRSQISDNEVVKWRLRKNIALMKAETSDRL